MLSINTPLDIKKLGKISAFLVTATPAFVSIVKEW